MHYLQRCKELNLQPANQFISFLLMRTQVSFKQRITQNGLIISSVCLFCFTMFLFLFFIFLSRRLWFEILINGNQLVSLRHFGVLDDGADAIGAAIGAPNRCIRDLDLAENSIGERGREHPGKKKYCYSTLLSRFRFIYECIRFFQCFNCFCHFDVFTFAFPCCLLFVLVVSCLLLWIESRFGWRFVSCGLLLLF